ncbi:endonuclease domain-containing protein, partial [Candidatus Gracilibacteria bacterium]|nr:endonuclease domain-containing protein [Candidatus Gracilibacteria bacterium]
KYNLIIEIDGPHHEEGKRKWNDKIRDEYFLQKGFQTVRLKDKKDINKAVDTIDQYIYNNKN